MLVSIPTPSQTMTSATTAQGRYFNDWPLNEIEENMMTLATTCSQISATTAAAAAAGQQQHTWRTVSSNTIKHSRNSVVRCNACQRKFHSLGNLANHQQLYQH